MCIMARPKKVISDVTKEHKVSLVFSIGPDKYTARGNSVLEALQQIKPKGFMGICSVEAEVGGKHSKLPLKLVPVNLRRIFEKPIELALLAKRVEVLL